MIRLKPGVSLAGIREVMRPVLIAAEKIWRDQSYGDPIVTSACEGEHSGASWHYYGKALDFRWPTLDKARQGVLASLLREKIGPKYDVVPEGSHLHVEYDPKPKGEQA